MARWETIIWIYAAFGLLVAVALPFLKASTPRRTITFIVVTYIGALTFLPAGAYEGQYENEIAPPWVIGALIPSPYPWFNKAWVAALAALTVALRLDWHRIAAFRPKLADLPLPLFCLMPLAQMFLVEKPPAPSTLITLLLLCGCWGVPWLLGRVWLSDREGRVALADALILFTLALLPIAVIEGLSPQRIHTLLYGWHPFAKDGVQRPIGFRPMAFFEHGNQYGIWVCAAAYAAWWRARHAGSKTNHFLHWSAALVLLAMAFAAQSLGAVILLVLAIIWLECAPLLDRFPWLWRIGLAGAVYFAVTLARQLYAVKQTGYEGPLLRAFTAQFNESRRQSLVWRIERALDNIGAYKNHMAFGQARWDWYPSYRPWDMTLMLIGQFGLVGLSLIIAAIVSATTIRRGDLIGGKGTSRHLALGIAGMAIVDAMMNTYVFYPALVLLGSLAASPVRKPLARLLVDDVRRVDAPEPSWLESAPAAKRPGQKI